MSRGPMEPNHYRALDERSPDQVVDPVERKRQDMQARERQLRDWLEKRKWLKALKP